MICSVIIDYYIDMMAHHIYICDNRLLYYCIYLCGCYVINELYIVLHVCHHYLIKWRDGKKKNTPMEQVTG